MCRRERRRNFLSRDGFRLLWERCDEIVQRFVKRVFKNLSLGTVGNSIAGIVGGRIGGQVLAFLGAGGLDGIAGSLVSGGVGGAVVMAVIGLIKKAMSS